MVCAARAAAARGRTGDDRTGGCPTQRRYLARHPQQARSCTRPWRAPEPKPCPCSWQTRQRMCQNRGSTGAPCRRPRQRRRPRLACPLCARGLPGIRAPPPSTSRRAAHLKKKTASSVSEHDPVIRGRATPVCDIGFGVSMLEPTNVPAVRMTWNARIVSVFHTTKTPSSLAVVIMFGGHATVARTSR